ncbi:hypothetical protein HA402_004608 [Bradysia odoriphaga]|nr:hypothetical protein HA402_004608 [Bradysia odoriphaga]
MENIQFGMKVWNSIEFNLLTKHEIITEECCKLIENVSAELETVDDIDAAWIMINEFLGLKCSPGAVGSPVKTTLTKTLIAVVNGVKCRRYIVYKGLIALLQNTSMQSFFKSNSKSFAMLVGASIDYLAKILESNESDSRFERSDPLVREVVQITKNYLKQTPFLNEFRKPFVKHLLIPLTELFISLRKDGTIDETDFFSILHEIYFADNEKQNPFNQLLPSTGKQRICISIERIFQPFKVETSTQGLFIQFLFNVYFKPSNEKFANEQQMLLVVSLFLAALKRYDVPLNFDIAGVKATEYIGKNIESFNITEANLYEILSVLCASIELNPMMLEHSIIPLVVRCMLHRKDDRTTMIFERFLILVIDMYRRLSRSEKFISNLMRTMWQKLSEMKLSKKLKRKLGTVDANASFVESPKRQRLESVGNVDATTINGNLNDEENRIHKFLLLLTEHLVPIDGRAVNSTHTNEDTFQWKNIQFAWPNRVGESFSKFISGLVSKPSLVVWKTLIFTLNDYVKLIKDGDLSENSLFLIDWTSALLCQYFHGCRLAEQSDKTWEMIDNNRRLQHNLLKDFGSAILSQEHNIRTMNAFLTLCFASGNFDLLRWFYCPDSITSDQIERSIADNTNNFVHSYLQPTEWVLIEQRISNFGKHECRSNLNRLYMQKIKSKLVIKRSETVNHQSNETVDVANHLLPSTLTGNDDLSELNDILLDETTNQWFIEQLTRSQKIQVARNVVELDCDTTENYQLTKLLVNNVADQEFFDFLAVATFEKISLQAVDNMFILKRVNFEDVFAGNDSFCKELFRGMKNNRTAALNLEEQSMLHKACRLLDILPLGFVSLNVKNILLHLSLGLLQYSDKENVHIWCKYLKKFLLLGDAPDVFRYVKVKQLPRIFDNCESDLEVMYKLFFERKLNELSATTTKMLSGLLQLVQAETFENVSGCTYMDIGVRLLEFFNKNKKCKELGTQYRDVILLKIREFFDHQSHSNEDEQTFVRKTASGFVHIISTLSEFDDQLKKVVKIYVENMQNCYDSHSIKLLTIIVSNKASFGYTDSDITKIIDKFWNELISDLGDVKDPNVYQAFVKFVFNLKSSEELIVMLTALNSINAADEDALRRFEIFEKLFRLIFKCQLNKAKGGIFSEFFRQVSFQIIIKLRNFDASTQRIVRQKLLDCQKHLCTNIQIPVTFDLIDDIIGFMSETIKQQQIKTITDVSILKETHTRISDLCYGLIQHRHYFIIDRIPQFVVILKDLLQSVCWFKCNRVRGKQLDDDEVTALAELSHKMENIIKAFVKHAKEVKRIAPYFLLFIINLMISKENVSTMYSKIKTHFDSVCYDLISVCDHRVEGFIMRNCNEASKQQYETMVKEYRKYHKFKGKV